VPSLGITTVIGTVPSRASRTGSALKSQRIAIPASPFSMLAFEVRDHGVSVAERVATIAGESSGGGITAKLSPAKAAADYADIARREYGVPR